MRAFAYETGLVVGLDLKDQAAAVNFDEGALSPDLHTDGRGGQVRDVEPRADGVGAGLKVRAHGEQRRLLHERHHNGRGQNVQSAGAQGLRGEVRCYSAAGAALDSEFDCHCADFLLCMYIFVSAVEQRRGGGAEHGRIFSGPDHNAPAQALFNEAVDETVQRLAESAAAADDGAVRADAGGMLRVGAAVGEHEYGREVAADAARGADKDGVAKLRCRARVLALEHVPAAAGHGVRLRCG